MSQYDAYWQEFLAARDKGKEPRPHACDICSKPTVTYSFLCDDCWKKEA